MRRRTIALISGLAAAAVAIPIALVMPAASADDLPAAPPPGAADSLSKEAIYGKLRFGAKAKVPPLTDPSTTLDIPGFGQIGLSNSDMISQQNQLLKLQSEFFSFLARMQAEFPDMDVSFHDPNDPAVFANWALENGSDTIPSPGGENSSTSPSDGVTYDMKVTGANENEVTGRATAKVDVPNSDVKATATTDLQVQSANAGAKGKASLRIDANVNVNVSQEVSGELSFRMSDIVTVSSNDGFTVQAGPSGITVGATTKVEGGPTIGVSVVINADGSLGGVSVGGTADVPGVGPVQVRADATAGQGASIGLSPVKGLEVGGESNGNNHSVSVVVNFNEFIPVLNRLSGK